MAHFMSNALIHLLDKNEHSDITSYFSILFTLSRFHLRPKTYLNNILSGLTDIYNSKNTPEQTMNSKINNHKSAICCDLLTENLVSLKYLNSYLKKSTDQIIEECTNYITWLQKSWPVNSYIYKYKDLNWNNIINNYTIFCLASDISTIEFLTELECLDVIDIYSTICVRVNEFVLKHITTINIEGFFPIIEKNYWFTNASKIIGESKFKEFIIKYHDKLRQYYQRLNNLCVNTIRKYIINNPDIYYHFHQNVKSCSKNVLIKKLICMPWLNKIIPFYEDEVEIELNIPLINKFDTELKIVIEI
uniref:Uncharacterized protein n=1 Tax=viral metagenome TaxID=1070528 RepID=A0A6C0LRN4_9ZZZZ